jgi:hypothetical protein
MFMLWDREERESIREERSDGKGSDCARRGERGCEEEGTLGMYLCFLIEKWDDFSRWNWCPRPGRCWRCIPDIICSLGGIGVISIAVRAAAIMRHGAVLLPSRSSGDTAFGWISAGKLFSKETLKFPETTSRAARLRTGTAGGGGDAGDRRPPLIEIGDIGRFCDAAGRGLGLARVCLAEGGGEL